jgi:adenylate cyclase
MSFRKHTAKRGLPAHWQRGRALAALVIFLITAAATYAASHLVGGGAERLDGWWLKARFRAREHLLPPSATDPDIVLVEIDDKTTKAWEDLPFIGWGGRLATAIDRLAASGVKVIGLDWTQPISTFGRFPGNDDRLSTALSHAGNVVMVQMVTWQDRTKDPKWVLPHPQLLYALRNQERDLGYAELHTADLKSGSNATGSQADSEVAALAPILSDSNLARGFAARIVERYLEADGALLGRRWVTAGRATPLRDDDTVLVNYREGTGNREGSSGGAFDRRSLVDVTRLPEAGDATLRGKIVIIGATYTGSNEQHYIPILEGLSGSRQAFGPEIHANLVRTLLDGKPVGDPDPNARWLMSFVVGALAILAFYRFSWLRAKALCIALVAGWIGAAFWLFNNHTYALPINPPLIGLVLGGGLMASYRGLREEGERRQVLGLWGRYQDPRLVDYLLQHPEARGGEGWEAEVTVLFADLKNFTKTVEMLPPGEALQTLNRYLAVMSEVILKHGGLVDKYLGDGLMAQWGVPEPQADHAGAAVRACLEIDRRIRELTDEVGGRQDVTFGIRLTLHTGPVVVGWVGADRLEFTIIGDTVNVTSRLQETAKQLECEFLVSETTYEHVRGWIRTGREADVAIRGRQQPLRVYEVRGERLDERPLSKGSVAAANERG